MLLFPAMDLLGGQVVRLYQGNYNASETFGNNPTAFAQTFEGAGATHLHMVDLDGAKTGRLSHLAAVRAVVAATGLFVELGGGIRDEDALKACYEAGVKRVILGTAALRNPAFTRSMLEKFGDAVAIGVDARDGRVAVEGWLKTSHTDSLAFCREMRQLGAAYIIYTDIARDGTGAGANLKVYEKLASIEGLKITASGGVSSLADIAALRDMGLYAAILGRALYTGALELGAALREAAG